MPVPLAERMRPKTFADLRGQEAVFGEGAPLRRALDAGRLTSVVLWGPPGCGKTTVAKLLFAAAKRPVIEMSAVLDGIGELRKALDQVGMYGAVVFVDEIHRWNKAQQDALLPHVESGKVLLVGATTENPSFHLNAALRSRVQLVKLEPLGEDGVLALLERALATDEELVRRGVCFEGEALRALARAAAGDARRAYVDLDAVTASAVPGETLGVQALSHLLARDDLRHDRSGTDHYDVLSAFIKSLRGSDPDAAVYWLARLLHAGEPVELLARRMMIFAAEDVGCADPRGLQVAAACAVAVERTGMPEARIVLSETAIWLATSPKSNRAYLAIDKALDEVKRTGALPVPAPLRATAGSRGDAEPYRYPHDHPGGVVAQQYLPTALQGVRFYDPSPYAEEKLIADRMAWWTKRRREG
jgi:putative ATPase